MKHIQFQNCPPTRTGFKGAAFRVLACLMMFISFSAFAQKNNVSGVVTDKNTNEPVAGAALMVKGTSTGTVTNPDGTYTAQVCWVENRLDAKGNVRLDEQNPDESLRNVECDKIIIIKGLVYNPDKQKWGGTKVYDPTRGFRASVQCEFVEDGRLRVKGTLLCFSQSIYWKKIE